MRKHIFSNFGLKLVSVFIAFLMWLMVVNGDDPETRVKISNVPITVKNEDKLDIGLVYKPKDEVTTVSVYVKGRKSVVRRLKAADFTVTADFENMLSMTLTSISLDIECSNKSITSENLECYPRSLKVDIEEAKEESFIVSAVADGKPAAGYEVGEMWVSVGSSSEGGETIKITGPESTISRINKVQATVKVGDLEESGTLECQISILDHNGDGFTESQMSTLTFKTSEGILLSNNKVDVKVSLWRVQSDIQLNVSTTGDPAEGYEVAGITTSPATVSLVGSEEVLEEVGKELVLEDVISVDGVMESFEKTLDLSEYLLEKYNKSLRVKADTSDSIGINVQIEQKGTKKVEVPVSTFEVIGQVPEGMNMTLTPADKITFEVWESVDAKKELKADDITVTLDLTKYQKADYYKVVLDIELPEDYELVADVTIALNLEETPETTEAVTGGGT